MSERNSDELLALAVVAQACEDLKFHPRTQVYRQARAWILSEAFEKMCLEADVCPMRVRDRLTKEKRL